MKSKSQSLVIFIKIITLRLMTAVISSAEGNAVEVKYKSRAGSRGRVERFSRSVFRVTLKTEPNTTYSNSFKILKDLLRNFLCRGL